ncbi:MAG: hypothetical protein RL742_131 [Bacteroidota bacterium]|jgi:subtilisin family serine protease
MYKYSTALLLALLGFAELKAQTDAARKPGELLLQLQGDATPASVLAEFNRSLPADAPAELLISRADDWRIARLGFDEDRVPAEEALTLARRIPGVRAAQFNHRAPDRNTEPNDPEWWRQDDMNLIGAPEAWDASTGGLSAAGDTIVAAVLEKGMLLTHPDLLENRWFNWADRPDNNLDDDGNGYVDDHASWDARFGGDGPGNSGNHGTGVNGIIGAQGNNNQGVTGVNWQVKLMNLTNVEYENEIIDAYYYVHKMRRLYNQTNGAKGAFVVTTNASFGIDREKAEDHPLWCAVYDSLGKVGIISIGATSNSGNSNVDVVGDMPTSCPSEFLITVTNTDKLDNLVSGAGFGPLSIDLGAPGKDTYTTSNSGPNTATYGTLGGTSAAAPHATGAVALLYSLDCPQFTADALTNPADCARRVRDVILENVEPNPTLDGKTTTGGRLSLSRAVSAVQKSCGANKGPLDILTIKPSPARDQIEIEFQTPNFTAYPIRIFNALGQLMYETSVQPEPFAASRETVSVRAWPAGVYWVAISRGKSVKSKKFLKI